MILRNMCATKKQWLALFLPILLLFMTIAYRFDFNANFTSDLNRWFQDFVGLRRYGFDYEMRYADEFSWFWRVISYVFAHISNLHMFPAFSIAVDYAIFFYILADVAGEKRLKAYEVLCCFVIRLAFLPLIMSVSACRNVLAYAFFSLGYYIYYKQGLKNPFVYVWMILGVLTHSTVFLAIVVFALSLIAQKYRKTVVLFTLVGIAFVVVIAPMLADSTNDMFIYFGERWDMYIDNPNSYEVIKARRIVRALLPLLVVVFVWYMGKESSIQKRKTSYIVSNMSATVGVYAFMPELFLRMCYPTAMLFPILWGELRSSEWGYPEKRSVYVFCLITITVLGFISTLGLWFTEIYWFFTI